MKLVYAITGANGQIGSFFVEYLRNCGHTVYELVRASEKAKNKDYYKFFDLAQPQEIASLQGIDVLIHTAYFFDTKNKDYETINIEGTQKLFQQASRDRVKYSIFISTLSAHPSARSLYGQTKYELEQLLKSENQKVCIIRPGLIFHKPLQGITAAMDNFVRKFPFVPLIGNGMQLIYPCLLGELVNLIYELSINQPIITRPIIAAAEKAITFRELVKYLAKQRQKRVLLFPIPYHGIYYLLKIVEFFGLSLGLRSDSLVGIHYAGSEVDFSETRNLAVHFSELNN